MAMLKSMILRHGWQSLSPTAIAREANARTIERTDRELWGYSGLASRFGSDVAAQIDGILKAAGMEWVRLALGGRGISFADPVTRVQVQAMADAGAVSQTLADALLAIGLWRVSPWQDVAGEDAADVTEADCQAALDAIAADEKAHVLRVRLADKAGEVAARITAGEVTDWVGVIAAMSEGV